MGINRDVCFSCISDVSPLDFHNVIEPDIISYISDQILLRLIQVIKATPSTLFKQLYCTLTLGQK